MSGLFVGLLALLFANGLAAQKQTTARDSATGKANVVNASLQSSMRNATAVAVDSVGLRIDAVVITAAGVFECRAWALDAGGALRYSTGADARDADTSGWSALTEGASGTLSGGRAFAAAGTRGIDLGISVSVGDATVPVTTAVTAQAVAAGGGAPACW
ncbi:hypothetical protein K0817_011450 [Microbacterium sp. HD4P20]|uniref:hypothetical protein n=1 Tax=Microbacterium sp. HD4P20 TaxID=2864874 RepID=UPI0020A4F67F|nr:hypothetical protein [Microbacterium sp. HD4P20]MCP2637174.1 hypothetical protein [Microbacterium sp. HD4P20]